MRRLFLCFLCLLLIGSLLLIGCGKKNISAAMDRLTDPRGSIPFNQSNYSVGFLETCFADYYTMWPEASSLAFIQVQPKGSDIFVPLCSKPNCMHNSESCNAVCIPGGGLGYCNNRLYAMDNAMDNSGGFVVVSMLPDGTDRIIETKIPNPTHSDGTQGGSFQFVFHENWLLALFEPPANLPLEEQIERLYTVNVQTNTITEPFSDFFTSKVSLGEAIRPVDNIIYAEAYFQNDDGTIENWWISMNMDTGDVKKLLSFDNPWTFNVEDDTLYYQLPEDGFMEYDLRTGTTTCRGLPMPDAVGDMRLDGELIYTLTNAGEPGNFEARDFTMYFLNRDYEVLDQIHLGPGVFPRYADKEFCFFIGPDSTKLIYRLDKTLIGTGSLELESLQ